MADPASDPHRPEPTPPGPWIVSQRWCDLLFAHWPVPAAALRPRIPERLEIETFDGTAWIAAVPFRMAGVRPRGLPALPGISTFPELNLRTYVRVDDRPGVFFFSLDAASRLVVSLGRRGFRLPYFRARIDCQPEGDGFAYRSTRAHPGEPPVHFAGRYRPAGDVFHAAPGSLDHFLTERTCLYASAASVGGSSADLFRAEVRHPPWPLQPAEATLEAGLLLASAGVGSAAREAPRVLFARAVDVRMWAVHRV